MSKQWRPLGDIGFAPLREARMQAYYAVQWLARAARGYIPPRPGDGHTNLGWDDDVDGFTTHPFPGGTALGLRIPDLTLALIDNGVIAQSFPLQGRSEAEARAWLGERMHSLGLSPGALDAALPYALPSHPLAQGQRYDASAEPLRALAAWYANGAASLGALRWQLVSRGLPVPEVRCWPHHFDLDCLTVFGDGAPYVAPTMGAGFSAGDHYYEEPYFYLSLHPRPDASLLPALHAPGHWHTQDFLAAVVPASRIVALTDRQAGTETFLFAAADEIGKVLIAQVARAAD